jgi:hypothetical protein
MDFGILGQDVRVVLEQILL